MEYRLFLIVIGTIPIMNLSLSPLASGAEESEVNEPAIKLMKNEERPEQKWNTDYDQLNDSLLDKDLNSTFQLMIKASPFFSLGPSLIRKVGEFLSPENLLQLANVSKYCLKSVSSRFNLELSIKNKELTKEDFVRYFGENGLYKEVQFLDLSSSSFHPAWLRLLPKTLKALKLNKINTQFFAEYSFEDHSTVVNEMIKNLEANTFPKLKFLDISSNHIGAQGTQYLTQLPALTHLDISENQIGVKGALHISKHLESLISLNVSRNQIGAEGAHHIAQLSALTHLDISDNQIGAQGAQYLSQLPSLTYLDISKNHIRSEGARHIAELTTLTHLDVSENQLGAEGGFHLSKLPALTHLNIGWNQIEDAGARHIAELTTLTHLDISENQLGSKGVCYIFKLTALSHLNISGNWKITEDTESLLRDSLPLCQIKSEQSILDEGDEVI